MRSTKISGVKNFKKILDSLFSVLILIADFYDILLDLETRIRCFFRLLKNFGGARWRSWMMTHPSFLSALSIASSTRISQPSPTRTISTWAPIAYDKKPTTFWTFHSYVDINSKECLSVYKLWKQMHSDENFQRNMDINLFMRNVNSI